jgi:predicted carbohydrate-binding protein with CBM5 and CBM33 domain
MSYTRNSDRYNRFGNMDVVPSGREGCTLPPRNVGIQDRAPTMTALQSHRHSVDTADGNPYFTVSDGYPQISSEVRQCMINCRRCGKKGCRSECVNKNQYMINSSH